MTNTRRILIVDDNSELREVLVEQLALHEDYKDMLRRFLSIGSVLWRLCGFRQQARSNPDLDKRVRPHRTLIPATNKKPAAVSHKLMAGTTDFYFFLSTPGGDVMSGLTIYNFLRALPVPITMHNIGNVNSIGNAIFVSADANHRLACAHSTFMFHEVGLDVRPACR